MLAQSDPIKRRTMYNSYIHIKIAYFTLNLLIIGLKGSASDCNVVVAFPVGSDPVEGGGLLGELW